MKLKKSQSMSFTMYYGLRMGATVLRTEGGLGEYGRRDGTASRWKHRILFLDRKLGPSYPRQSGSGTPSYTPVGARGRVRNIPQLSPTILRQPSRGALISADLHQRNLQLRQREIPLFHRVLDREHAAHGAHDSQDGHHNTRYPK